jgi:Ras-related protein Rab-11A
METNPTEADDSHDYVCKIVLIGESAVGKTNLLLRLCKDEFKPDSTATVGVEFAKKIFTIDDKKIKVQIWDTAGQERYKAVSNSYYRNAKGALIVYDITKRNSFEQVEKWVNDFVSVAGDETFLIIVGNKSDLPNRVVSKEEGEEKAKKIGRCDFIETSALRRTNVFEAFNNLTTSKFN